MVLRPGQIIVPSMILLAYLVPVAIRIIVYWNGLRVVLVEEGLSTVDTLTLLGHKLLVLSLYAKLLVFLCKEVFGNHRQVSLLPKSFEFFELLAEKLFAVDSLVVFFDFGYSFELHEHLLEMTTTLSSSTILQILLESLEDFASPK